MKRHDDLLDDADVKRWHDNQSVIWGDVALRALGRFCKTSNISPKKLVELSDKEMADRAQDYVQKLLKTKNPKTGQFYAPGYVDNCLTAIRSWCQFNDKPIKRKIRIQNSDSTPTLENERAPTTDELKKVLYDRNTEDRTSLSIAIIAFSGCRPEVQGDIHGTDGLRIKDLPEMMLKDGKVEFLKIPTMMKVRQTLSKSNKAYFTFLNAEGCQLLKRYLEKRIAAGENLNMNSGIIVSEIGAEVMQARLQMKDDSPILATPTITSRIRDAMKRNGLNFRPYVWRVYFDTHLITASGRGIIYERYVKFLTGHKGDIDSVYSTHKNTLPEDMLEDMRNQYEKASSQFLETAAEKQLGTQAIREQATITTLGTMIATGFLNLSQSDVRNYISESLGIERISQDDWEVTEVRESWFKKLKRKLGMKEDDILLYNTGEITESKGNTIINAKDTTVSSRKPSKDNTRGEQLSVLADDVDKYFGLGYRMLQGGAVLPNGKVVVEYVG